MSKIICLVFALIFLSCAQTEVGPQAPSETSGIVKKEVARENWQQIWEDTLAQARKEGKVVIHSQTPPEVNEALAVAFKKRMGITAEITTGGKGGQMQPKILAEQRAGLYLADLQLAGGTSSLILKAEKAVEPFGQHLFLPEVIDSGAWYDSRFPWWDKERTQAYLGLAPSTPLHVNTLLVKPGEINSYRDLLKPQWKKRILYLDPTIEGQGNQWFSVYAREQLLGLDYMKALVKQEPLLMRDKRLIAEWVAKGKYPVSLAVGQIFFQPFLDAGAPVTTVITEEPDYLSAASTHIVWLKNAPHPAAAKLFLNWYFSKEGALVVQKSYQRQSARIDISNEGLEATKAVRLEGRKYYNAETEEHVSERSIYDLKAKELFGPLLK